MGTLSKAVGSYGGYLCASRPVIDLMVNRARSLIYATGLPPATVAASSAALELIGNDAALVAAPMEKARRFCQAVGLPDPQSPIVPLITGDASRALDASAALATKGFLVIAIRPPTVPEGTARLRFTFQETHRDEDIDRLAAAVREIGLVG
jgi:8-amino-7-oxononanoate synthase